VKSRLLAGLGAQGSISTISLQSAFTCADSKSAKQHRFPVCIFALLGSAHIKATHKMLLKLIPGCPLTRLDKIISGLIMINKR